MQSADLRSHVVCSSLCPSVRLSVTLVDQDHIGSKSNCMDNYPNTFAVRSPKATHLLPGEHGKIWGETMGWEKWCENFRAPIYRAHREVIFAIAQLSCTDIGLLTVSVNTMYRQLPFLRGWPVHILTDNTRMASINYYRYLQTMSKIAILSSIYLVLLADHSVMHYDRLLDQTVVCPSAWSSTCECGRCVLWRSGSV